MTRAFIIAAFAFAMAGRPAGGAEETNSHTRGAGAAPFDFEAFRVISERNIFNPNRSGRRDTTRREPDRRSRVDSFSLVGTMSYEKGRIAFFDGTSSDYRKVLGAADTIAGYTVREITTENVTLQSTNQQEIKLPLGMQMRRVEDGEWELTERSATVASASSPGSESASSGSGGGADEVLKRLMQRREQDGSPNSEPAATAPREPAATIEGSNPPSRTEAGSEGGADEVLKRLLQRREQESQR